MPDFFYFSFLVIVLLFANITVVEAQIGIPVALYTPPPPPPVFFFLSAITAVYVHMLMHTSLMGAMRFISCGFYLLKS